MPNCFTLTRKSNLEAGPVKFTTIDEEMCRYFNVPCDPVKWYLCWYDTVGLALACGKSLAEILDCVLRDAAEHNQLEDEYFKKYSAMVVWLDTHFTSNAWYAPKSISG